MKRKILSFLAAFAMVVSVLVVPVNAEGNVVAKIGNEEYETISAAINAASDGSQIDVIASTQESIVIPEGSNITLNIKEGVTITNEDKKHTITNNGTLTINGSGIIDNISHGKGALYNNVGATATLNGCSYTRSQENGSTSSNNGGNSWYNIKNFGTMVINDGVTVKQTGAYSSLLASGWQKYSSALNGSSEPKPTVEAKLTINGGTFSGGINTIKNDDFAILEINGGNFVNVSQYAVMNWNVATINDGVFETQGNNASAAIWCGYDNDDYNKGKLTISGGTFKVENDTPSVEKGYPGAEVVISGGNYSSNVTGFVSEGNTSIAITSTSGETKATTYYVGTPAAIAAQVEKSESGDEITVFKGDLTVEVAGGITFKNEGEGTVIANNHEVNNDVELITKNIYTITFDSQGGTVVDSVTVEEGSQVGKPDTPEKEGYTFIGWYVGDAEYDFDSKVTGDLELTAKWKVNESDTTPVDPTPVDPTPVDPTPVDPETETVLLMLAAVVDGEVLDLTQLGISSTDIIQEIEKGFKFDEEDIKELEELSKEFDFEGYTFKGYYLDEKGETKLTSDYVFDKDTTIYMIWKKSEVVTPVDQEDDDPKVEVTPVDPEDKNPEVVEKVEQVKNEIKDKTVNTGDNVDITIYVLSGMLALAGLALGLLNKKRNEFLNK